MRMGISRMFQKKQHVIMSGHRNSLLSGGRGGGRREVGASGEAGGRDWKN